MDQTFRDRFGEHNVHAFEFLLAAYNDATFSLLQMIADDSKYSQGAAAIFGIERRLSDLLGISHARFLAMLAEVKQAPSPVMGEGEQAGASPSA